MRQHSSEDGFTMVELMVALLVMGILMGALAYVLTNSLVDVAYSRQRVEATTLANQTVEQVRALSWTTIQQGQQQDSNANATPAIDPNFTSSGCFEGTPIDLGGAFASGCTPQNWIPRTACNANGVAPPAANQLSGSAPLRPHEACYVVAGTTYIVDTYLTGTNSGSLPYTLTVYVSWTKGSRRGSVNYVNTTTLLSGCSIQRSC